MTIHEPVNNELALDAEPEPGPRGSRPRWNGSTIVQTETTQKRTFGRYLPTPAKLRRRQFQQRNLGIDATKGFALLAIIAVHALPRLDPVTGEATWTWSLFAGTATALFCVLAGVSLAMHSGANQRYRGRAFQRSLVNVVFRAVLMVGLGLAVNSLVDLDEANILVYFGAMYLLVLPLMALHGRQLLALCMLFVVSTPIIRYIFDAQIQGEGYYVNPVFSNVFQDPLGVLSTVFLTGAFPALTWITFVCLGLAIGRLTLLRPGISLLFVTVGLIMSIGAQLISWFIVRTPEGFDTVWHSMSELPQDQVDRFLEFGPNGTLPTDTPGWLLSAAPMAATPLSIAVGLGFSLTVIGIFIALAGKFPKLLHPLIDIGTMPITMFVGHLLLFTLAGGLVSGWGLFILEVLVLGAFAALWRKQFGFGPLELFITSTAVFAAKVCVPERSVEQHN